MNDFNTFILQRRRNIFLFNNNFVVLAGHVLSRFLIQRSFLRHCFVYVFRFRFVFLFSYRFGFGLFVFAIRLNVNFNLKIETVMFSTKIISCSYKQIGSHCMIDFFHFYILIFVCRIHYIFFESIYSMKCFGVTLCNFCIH